MPPIETELVKDAFKYNNLAVFNDSAKMVGFLEQFKEGKIVFLMMSSGNFDRLKMKELANKLLV